MCREIRAQLCVNIAVITNACTHQLHRTIHASTELFDNERTLYYAFCEKCSSFNTSSCATREMRVYDDDVYTP